MRHPLDAVFVLTSGSHAPIAEAAAQAGLHVFVEKPMCYSADEGAAMVAAVQQAGVTLMVGYPKRDDPAFARLREELGQLSVTAPRPGERSRAARTPRAPAGLGRATC